MSADVAYGIVVIRTLTLILWFIDEIGNNHKFIFNDDRLANIYSFSKETGKYQELLKLIMVEQPIFMALNDLISSIAINDQVMINCARSVEAIRHMICGHGMAPAKAWPIMRSCLNLDHKYIHLITDNSTQHRHGNHIAISAYTVREVLIRSWAIMDRFLQYRLNGNKQLSILKFPLLEG